MNAFIALPRHEKEIQLNGLTNLVTGIRLFNKYLEKGGETIEKCILIAHQVPEYCELEFKDVQKMLTEQMQRTESQIQQFHAIIEYYKKTPNSEVSEDLHVKIRPALVLLRQYLIYLDVLQEQVDTARKNLSGMDAKFNETFKTLKTVCKSKTAVPVDQVYV